MDSVKAAYQRVRECLAIAEQHYKCVFSISAIRFDLKGRVAGQFRVYPDGSQPTIRINRILLEANLKEVVGQTIPHEVAHLVAFQLYGKGEGHGPRWQAIMTDCFGLAPDRCHRMDTTQSSPRPYQYRCRCRTFQLSKRMHSSISSGRFRICNSCKGRLDFVRMEQVGIAKASMDRLFVVTADGGITPEEIRKISQLVGDHKVGELLVPTGICQSPQKATLLKALQIPADRCKDHPREETLPGGLSHAIIIAERGDSRLQRAGDILRERGVKVRLLERV